MVSIVMTVKYTHVNKVCSHRRDISLCIVLYQAITLKELHVEYISRMQQKPYSGMPRGFVRNEFHRERFE